MTNSWLHLTVHAAPENLDALSNFLIERGAPGVVVKERGVEAYFFRGHDDAQIKRAVARYVRDVQSSARRRARPRMSWRVVRRENWHDHWRRFIKPRRIGKRFWVTPPWARAPKFRSRQVITIEPGLAFGTGTHATTRGCMEFIEQAVAGFGGSQFTALDVGTGSGILAIAMAQLGAREVWAIDHDPVALEVARENLRANDVLEKVRLSDVKLSAIRRKFPLVVANLTAETLSMLAVALKKKVEPAGFLILAGILRRQASPVMRRFSAEFRVERRKSRGEWVTLLLRRKGRSRESLNGLGSDLLSPRRKAAKFRD